VRQIACPVALHPDGGIRRIACFSPAHAGLELVTTALPDGAPPATLAAKTLYDQSGLETTAAIAIGQSPDIQEGAVWHFSLCRIKPPVRAQWQHFYDANAQRLHFHWMALDAAAPDQLAPPHLRALDWIRATV